MSSKSTSKSVCYQTKPANLEELCSPAC